MNFHGRIIALLVLSTALYAKVPNVQVRIGKNLKSIIIHGTDLEKEQVLTSKTKSYSGKKVFKFNCKSNAKSSDPNKPILLASLSSPSGIISWGKKDYRGNLHVTTSETNRSCDLINESKMEDYISTLLAKEMNSKWPIEALKAQAIAARTYALHRMNLNKNEIFHLENSEQDQVSGTYSDETIQTRKASMNTQGLVLMNKKGKLVPSFFHSKCGGLTLAPQHVWSEVVVGYKQVECIYCAPHGKKNWMRYFSKDRLKNALLSLIPDKAGKKAEILILPSRNSYPYVRFYIDDNLKIVSKAKLRKKLGRRIFPSNNFSLVSVGSGFRMEGSGYGHGVGMCQYGAFEMAKKGLNYKQILAYYYPNLNIKKIY